MECLRSVFYQLCTTQFYFNEAISAVTQMYYGIALEAVGIPVVINFTAKCISIYPQIPYSHCFKQKTRFLLNFRARNGREGVLRGFLPDFRASGGR